MNATMPDKFQYRPSEAQKRLDAEVKARLEKQKAQGGAVPNADAHKLAEILKQAGVGDFKPSDLQGALVQIQRKNALEQRQAQLAEQEKEALSQTSQEVMLAVSKLFGGQQLMTMTPEEVERADAEIRESYRKEVADIQAVNREAEIRKIIPENFRGTFDMKKVAPTVNREEVKKVTQWKYSPRGLYIYGTTGRSKTWALYHLAERLLREGHSVMILDGPAFSIAAGAAFSEPSKTEAWLNSLVRPDVLIIDDLGKRWTPATEDAAFAVVDRRTARRKPVLCSINYTGDELKAMSHAMTKGDLAVVRDITTPLRRRLKDYCETAIF